MENKIMVYYYQEIRMDYIDKVAKAIESRMKDNSTDLVLKNGKEFFIQRSSNGDVRVYDDDCNLITEFDNEGYNEYCKGFAMFNTAVFIIRESRR